MSDFLTFVLFGTVTFTAGMSVWIAWTIHRIAAPLSKLGGPGPRDRDMAMLHRVLDEQKARDASTPGRDAA